jgi:hypothetical protein
VQLFQASSFVIVPDRLPPIPTRDVVERGLKLHNVELIDPNYMTALFEFGRARGGAWPGLETFWPAKRHR